MKRVFFIIVALCFAALALQAQEKKATPAKKTLTPAQKKQVEVLKKNKDVKRDNKAFVKAFYAPVLESCETLRKKNRELADKMRDISQKAVVQGKPSNMLKYDNYRKIYEEANTALGGIEEAIKKGNTADTAKGIEEYIRVEGKLKSQNLELAPRQWFSVKEAEKVAFGK